eukprot:TRINITY_DN19324_c0_g2_i3.p1 TRINITY_DN19324_c0_g2~~TRINITY_DN19324_c0_g2_i3.p1  ORF type:complete len:215 (+),score=21.67 TRINITY_DN19324_c0_g2_i3:175-819(+)
MQMPYSIAHLARELGADLVQTHGIVMACKGAGLNEPESLYNVMMNMRIPSDKVLVEEGSSQARCTSQSWDCKGPECCSWPKSCFEQDDSWSACRASCAPGHADPSGEDGKPWTCRQPFADPLAQARQTYRWAHIVAVCSAGEALVDPLEFHSRYGSDCETYCRRGAGEVVDPEFSYMWKDYYVEGAGQLGHCTGDETKKSYEGVRCYCTFPDRL